jgi:phage gp29-like protein
MAKAVLYDQWGREIDLTRLKEEQARPSLSGVRPIISAHPSQGLTPARLAKLLRDSEDGDPIRYLELAEDMEEKDPHYLSVLGTRKRAITQLEITVEAASDDANDVANADLVREWLKRDVLEDELFDVLDAIGKGYSATEIIWDVSERQWQPLRLEWRDPRWFVFDPADGRTLHLREMATVAEATVPGAVPLAPFKFITHQAKIKTGLPVRGGIARAIAWCYLFKNFDLKDWVVFAETYGHPLRVGKYGAGASQADKDTLLSAVANIASDAAAIIPQSMVIEFIESKMQGNVDLFERFANYLDQQMSKAVLGQVGTTDAVAGGYAVGKVHNDVRGDIERSDAMQLAATLNRDLVRPMIDLNRGPQAKYPRLRIGRREEVDTEKFMAAVEKYVQLGGRVEQSVVRDKLGLPDPPEDDDADLLQARAAPPAPAAGTSLDLALQIRNAGRRQRLARHAAEPQGDNIDPITGRLLDVTQPAIEEMLAAVRRMVDESDSLAEVAEKLQKAYPALGGASLAEVMGEALALSGLVGRDSVMD